MQPLSQDEVRDAAVRGLCGLRPVQVSSERRWGASEFFESIGLDQREDVGPGVGDVGGVGLGQDGSVEG